MKRWIPSGVRLRLKLLLRFLSDLRSGQLSRIVRRKSKAISSDAQGFESRVEIIQILKAASYAENKRHNLTIAAAHIQNVVIQPGEIFSFWALVGAPIARRGYREGRALVQGQLKAVMGGGLCQLSGILYYLSLQGGLTPLERYPHSADIYTDETRFTPLGSDATVVYGYKDFRFVNDLTQPLCFRISITPDRVIAQLCTPDPIQTYHVEFRPTKIDDRTEVETLRKPIDDLVPSLQLRSVNISRYR